MKIALVVALILTVSFLAYFAISFASLEFGFTDVPIPVYVMLFDQNMSPFIKVGDMVFIDMVNFDEIKIGDVIAYKVNSETVTYRIVEINNDQVITQGDNLLISSTHIVNESNYIGSVISTFNGGMIYIVIISFWAGIGLSYYIRSNAHARGEI